MTSGVLRTYAVDSIDFIRIMAGVFFLPHIGFKVLQFSGAVGFFSTAGFIYPEAFVVLTLVVESIAALGMLFKLQTAIAGLLGGLLLLVAAGAVVNAKGTVWLWNLGGAEYCVFWALICFAVSWAHRPA